MTQYNDIHGIHQNVKYYYGELWDIYDDNDNPLELEFYHIDQLQKIPERPWNIDDFLAGQAQAASPLKIDALERSTAIK